ncbi:hypothetical protein [Fonticella tunisiensis]|uniref:YopX protein domain-containing protein n=1 Tax=Fonticella tunisiensis TaxID=1096341 RepID=A0A4R7KTH6_9CLOT|nr:hypothetical protein [Fonticella tunisiensis]TDT63408.1 hypothetical protein EDD71_102170 [Fonticella tunisiensis]
MKYYYYGSANYIELEDDEKIIEKPVELGDKLLVPGDFVKKIGEKERSSFEMQEGYFLKYMGYVESEYGKDLLFGTNVISADTRRFYYSFAYIDKNTLLVQGNQTGFWDIRVEKLEVFKDVEMKYIHRQLSFI